MCVCVYLCVCVCLCYVYLSISICVSVCLSLYMYLSVSVCVCVCLGVRMLNLWEPEFQVVMCCLMWELNLDILEALHVLLTSEPSSQPSTPSRPAAATLSLMAQASMGAKIERTSPSH